MVKMEHSAVVGPGRRGAAGRWRASLGAVALCGVYVSAGVAASTWGSSNDLRQMSARLAAAVGPHGSVLTDDPMVPFLARRSIPPALIDTSYARFAAQALRPSMLDEAIEDTTVRAVVFWRGTFLREAPAFGARAAVIFPMRVEAGGDRFLDWR